MPQKCISGNISFIFILSQCSYPILGANHIPTAGTVTGARSGWTREHCETRRCKKLLGAGCIIVYGHTQSILNVSADITITITIYKCYIYVPCLVSYTEAILNSTTGSYIMLFNYRLWKENDLIRYLSTGSFYLYYFNHYDLYENIGEWFLVTA